MTKFLLIATYFYGVLAATEMGGDSLKKFASLSFDSWCKCDKLSGILSNPYNDLWRPEEPSSEAAYLPVTCSSW